MSTPPPLLYPIHPETVKRASSRFLSLDPPPELLLTEPTARLERGFFPTVAAVCDALSEAHALEHMTRGDLRRLARLGELAGEMLGEKTKEIEKET